MQALIATPGRKESIRFDEAEAPKERGVRIRTLEIGVCGTDREISDGEYGVAPEGEDDLILGHEFLGEVVEDGSGFSAGDLVTATVRRGCGKCDACKQGAPDSCATGDYTERGITRMHGFAREELLEDPDQLVAIPKELGRFGVLAEPSSVCARGIRHALAVGRRQPWEPERALVIGAGAIGMLVTYFLRLEGLEVWTTARSKGDSSRAELVEIPGARYVSSEQTPLPELRDEVGGFDVVIEAAGNAQLMLDVLGLLRRNGVGCLLGIDGNEQEVSIDGPVIGVDTVLENRVLLGSVNAHIEDWQAAVENLGAIRKRWPDALDALIGLRVPPDRFAEAFGFRGVKATLVFD
jgi:glucose 1-dehydrogenase